MAPDDDTFVGRVLEPWNQHDVDGALALMTGDCVVGDYERPRAAWHALHRAGGRSRGDRGGVQGAARHQLPTRSDVARSGGLMTDIISCTITTFLPIRRKSGSALASKASPGHRSRSPSSCRNPI